MPTLLIGATISSTESARSVPTITYKIADTPAERRDAFQLVYESYFRAGLCEPNEYRQRVTPYHLLPTTTVFNAYLDGLAISTLSLIADGALGLPMESIYPDEVQRCRDSGLYVGEVSCLADQRSSRKRFFSVFCSLTRLMAQYTRSRGMHQLLAAVHPKHARFYERFLGFRPIGGLRGCPHVENKPAVALSLDFQRVDCEPPGCYDSFFGEKIPPEQLQTSPMGQEERGWLAQVVNVSFKALGPTISAGAPVSEMMVGAPAVVS